MRPRLIPQLDKNPWALEMARRPVGRIAMLLLFGGLLKLATFPRWIAVPAALGVLSFFPRQRYVVLAILAALWAFGSALDPSPAVMKLAAAAGLQGDWRLAAASIAGVAITYAFAFSYWQLARITRSAPMNRPLLTLLVSYLALISIVSAFPLTWQPSIVLWSFLIAFGHFVWFLGYGLADRAVVSGTGLAQRVGYFRPFWNFSSPTPFPQGAVLGRRLEVKDDQEAAVWGLKALKLAAWAAMLSFVLELVEGSAYGRTTRIHSILALPDLRIPELSAAVQSTAQGDLLSPALAWSAVIAAFVIKLLRLTVFGHTIVAICRMAGLKALRNTWRPLESRSVADFWNRVYYYFKELLVHLFFYPTYLRYFKKHPRLRRFFATFMAAGVGNVLFHYFREIGDVVELGFWKSIAAMHVYAIYAVLLSVSIGISQLRSDGKPAVGRPRLRTTLSVLMVYCLLSVLDDPDKRHSIVDYARFMATLSPWRWS